MRLFHRHRVKEVGKMKLYVMLCGSEIAAMIVKAKNLANEQSLQDEAATPQWQPDPETIGTIVSELEQIVRHFSYDTKWDYDPVEDSDKSCREKMNGVLSELKLLEVQLKLKG